VFLRESQGSRRPEKWEANGAIIAANNTSILTHNFQQTPPLSFICF